MPQNDVACASQRGKASWLDRGAAAAAARSSLPLPPTTFFLSLWPFFAQIGCEREEGMGDGRGEREEEESNGPQDGGGRHSAVWNAFPQSEKAGLEKF